MESTIITTSAFKPVIEVKLEDRNNVIDVFEVSTFNNPQAIGKVFDEFFEISKYYNWSHYKLEKENKKLREELEELKGG
ncbi:MAG: hypothetical protein CFE21_11690 [Bacteroidetes bacterium B1(2017)]|nr:MAG: hypothetical protein CFE21_11690 [Bacteroidetes bacterium B1(2017)]